MPSVKYDQPSQYLTKQQAIRIKQAAEHACAQNRPLNRHWTIMLKDTQAEQNAQAFIHCITNQTRKWLQRRGKSHAYIWVLENGIAKGLHIHMLSHIPNGLQISYKRTLKSWCLKYGVTDIKVKGIHYPIYGELHPMNQIYGVVKYISKGINPKYQSDLADIKPRPQGMVYGRRIGMNIKD